jgi:hypothetical protein
MDYNKRPKNLNRSIIGLPEELTDFVNESRKKKEARNVSVKEKIKKRAK